MRTFLLWAGILTCALPGWAEPNHHRNPTIAVLPFSESNPDAMKDGLGISIASMFGTHLKNETSFLVVERSQVAKVLGEKSLQQTGLTDSQRKELEKLFDAEVLLAGEVSRFGNLIQLDARLVSAQTGQVLVAEYAEVAGYEKLRAAISQISRNLELKYLRQWMGDVSVSVQPVDAEVYLDGKFSGKATLKEPLRLQNLLEGRYALKVVAGGYRTVNDTLVVLPRGLREVQVALRALPGSLKIYSEPAGAKIRVNGKEIGLAPASVDTVSEGRYRVQFDLPGFQPLDREVEVRSGQQSELKAVLEVMPGRLILSSNPSGAVAFLDDKRVGVTPVAVDNVAPGTRSVRVEIAGRTPVKDVVTVKPGEEVPWLGTLAPLTGWLSVVPKTDSVQATLFDPDGRESERIAAPFHRKTLGIGKWTLRLERPLHKPATVTVRVDEGKETRVETLLEELPAKVQILSDGAPAQISMDGGWVGKTPVSSLDLPRGKHVVVWKSFFDQGADSLTVGADEHRDPHVRARRENPARWMIPTGIVLSTILLFATER